MYKIETLKEITERVESKIISEFSLLTPVLDNSFVKILARVIAMSFWLLQGFVDWGWRQRFAQYADQENLENIGFAKGVDPKPATFARGVVQLEGEEGAIIPEQTVIARLSDNYTYVTEAEITIPTGGVVQVNVVSELVLNGQGEPVQGIGEDANTPIDTLCELTSPITGVLSECFFFTAATGGFNAEDLESYRKRVLYIQRNPPQGGAQSDYVIWASSRPGVSDVFVTSNYPTVSDVYVTIGNYTDIDNPEVVQSTIDDVIEYVNSRDRRPVTALASVQSVIKTFVDLTIKIDPYTEDTAKSSDIALKNLFRTEGVPTSDDRPISQVTKKKIISVLSAQPNIIDVDVTSLKQDYQETDAIVLNKVKTAILRASTYSGY